MLNESYPPNGEESQQENEIVQARDALKLRNVELKMTLAYLRNENRTYKAQFQALNQRLNKVNEWLEKNVRLFGELFESTKNALQMGRASALNSPLPEHEEEKSVHRENPKLGYLGGAITRRKLHIERLNIKELEQSLENHQNISETRQETEGEPTTVVEKSSPNISSEPHDSNCIIREVYVRLSRLPHDVVQKHLRKNHHNVSVTPSSSFEITTSFAEVMEPENTSTPLKVETMRQLGLYPCGSNVHNNFVSTRKRENIDRNDSSTMKRIPLKMEESPVKAKKTKIQNNGPSASNKRALLKKEPKELRPNVLRSPRVRKAKPQNLKEPSLHKKMRAE